MGDVLEELRAIVGEQHVLSGDRLHSDYTHDEALSCAPVVPLAVVLPGSAQDVSRLLALADAQHLSVVARGSGTGLSGGARPVADGVVVVLVGEHHRDIGAR